MSDPMDNITRTDIGSTMCQSVSPSRCNHVASIGSEPDAMPPTSNHPSCTANSLIARAARKNVGSDIPIIANTVTV